jgi:hypothetical protein
MIIKDGQEKNRSEIKIEPASDKKISTVVLVVLLLLAVGAFGATFYKYRQTQTQLQQLSSAEGQKAIAKKDIDELLAKLRKHIVLPVGEDPVVATVTDKDALAKEQPFYQNAHNGDRVLAYIQARKAIIYDPIKDVVVNAGPIYMSDQPSATSTGAVK